LEQNLQIERKVLYRFLIGDFGGTADIEYCEGLLRIFVHNLDGLDEDLDLLEFVKIWRKCGSLAGLKILLQTFDTFVQAMSAEETFRFFSASLTTRESAASYMAKIDLCCGASSTNYFYRKMGTLVLYQVATVGERGRSGSDLEGWMRIGVTAIQNGTDLHAIRWYTRKGVLCPHTPLTYLLWSSASGSSTKAISTALERWTHMLNEAKIDLTTYYTRESETGTLSHVDVGRISYTSPSTVVSLAALDYDPLTKTCNLRMRHRTSIPLLRLDHLPGSFPSPVEIPDTICWRPNHEELEEGRWLQSKSEGAILRDRVMDVQGDRRYAGSYLGLVDSTQDDTGSLIRMIDMSDCDRRSRKRASSEPDPLYRRRYDYERLRRSKVHTWLPEIHFCTYRSTWIFSGHSSGSFADARSCVKGHGMPDKGISDVSGGGFLSEIRHCQCRGLGWSYSSHKSVMHDGTPDCPQGCRNIDLSTIPRPPTLPYWHPGSYQ
jgi:hypothetical protein